MELTKEAVGARIREALAATGRKPEWLASEAQISISSLNRYMKGTHDVSALEMWRIARATRKPFAWFAGELDPPQERLATVAEHAEHAIQTMQASLAQLLKDLASARAAVSVDEAQLDIIAGASGRAGQKRAK